MFSVHNRSGELRTVLGYWITKDKLKQFLAKLFKMQKS